MNFLKQDWILYLYHLSLNFELNNQEDFNLFFSFFTSAFFLYFKDHFDIIMVMLVEFIKHQFSLYFSEHINFLFMNLIILFTLVYHHFFNDCETFSNLHHFSHKFYSFKLSKQAFFMEYLFYTEYNMNFHLFTIYFRSIKNLI